MIAQAVVCSDRQIFSLERVTVPEPDAESVVIRTRYSGISVGTEFALVRGKISWGPYPICTGYMAVGVIEQAGAQAGGFKAGDRVYYRDNGALRLADGRAVSSVAGTHCSRAVLNVCKTHGLARLPDGVDEAAASMFVLPAVGLFGTDMAAPRMGQSVVVYGCGLIGLGVVAACVQRGCVVIAVDLDERRLALAGEFGAAVLVNSAREKVEEAVRRVAPEGADVVFEATGIPACLDPAIALARPFGKFVWQGNYGEAPVSLHFMPPHMKRLTMFFPCDDGLAPCRRAIMTNLRTGALRWDRAISHRVPAAEAAAFFDRINRNAVDGLIGAVVDWTGLS